MTRCKALTVTAAILSLTVAGAPAVFAAEAAVHTRAAHLEAIPGSNLKKIILSDRAAKRLDIQTAEVVLDASGARVVPYAAIVYDLTGAAHVYTNPEAMNFVRHAVVVTRIAGASAQLSEGPAPGTKIAIVGVPQLYGAEKGVGH